MDEGEMTNVFGRVLGSGDIFLAFNAYLSSNSSVLIEGFINPAAKTIGVSVYATMAQSDFGTAIGWTAFVKQQSS